MEHSVDYWIGQAKEEAKIFVAGVSIKDMEVLPGLEDVIRSILELAFSSGYQRGITQYVEESKLP